MSHPSRTGGWPLALLASPPMTIVITVPVAAILAGASVLHGLADPDYFWHVATGRLILDSGIPHADPFSFTRAGQPWIADQWLSELAMAQLTDLAGISVGLAVFGAVPAIGVGALAAALLSRGVRPLAIVVAAAPFVLMASVFVTMRPQVLSWTLLAIELAILVGLTARSRWLALGLPPLFAVWANVHGLFVIGLVVGAAYLAATLSGRTALAGRPRFAVGIGLACAIATLLTPYGIDGLGYLLSFADSSDWGFTNLQEWQSPDFHAARNLPLLGLIVGLILVGPRRVPGWIVILSYLGVALALIAVRNAPVAGVLALPALAFGIDARLRPPVAATTNAPMRRRLEWATALVVALAAGLTTVANLPNDPGRTSDRFPVAAVERLRLSDPTARVLAHYGWGGYVIDQLSSSGATVFVDGRNHLYGESVLDDYSAIVAADPGWQSLVGRYGVEVMLLRSDTPLTRGIAQGAGWCEVYRDEQQVLLALECESA